MANELLFAGGRLDSLSVIGGVPAEVTTAATFDSSYADASISMLTADSVSATLVTASSGVLAATDVVAGETLFAHCEYKFPATIHSANTLFFTLYDSSGFPWLSLRTLTVNSGDMGVFYNSGTGASPVWTQVGATYNYGLVSANRVSFDLKVTLGSPHIFEFSVNGNLTISGSFTQASFTGVRSLRIVGLASTTNLAYVSQILCTRGISTIGAKIKTSRATGAGTNSAWTGVATNVNEAINSDATQDTSGTATQKQSYAMGDITVPQGFVIQGVFHWLRAKNDGAAPANLQSLIRSGGTDFATGNLSGIGNSYGPVGARYDTDPATSLAWTQAGWNAAEAGYVSAT